MTKFDERMNAVFTASEVLSHDLDPDDRYAVEKFLRKQNPRVSKTFVEKVVAEARDQRDANRWDSVFAAIAKHAVIGTTHEPDDEKLIVEMIERDEQDEPWLTRERREKVARWMIQVLVAHAECRDAQEIFNSEDAGSAD